MENRIRLYTSGRKANLKDFDKLRKFIYKWSATPYTFEIIDASRDPIAAKQDRIVVTPTIVFRGSPESSTKVIGNISNPEHSLFIGPVT